MKLPILYSFRRCPYAMRARLAIVMAGQQVELREVELRNKPTQLLEINAKATVPVLALPDSTVLAESFDIMQWALTLSDPEGLLDCPILPVQELIQSCDEEFKYYLDRYKYADRYPQYDILFYREKAEFFLRQLEDRLEKNAYLFGPKPCLADIAVMPFIRQFVAVDKQWFSQAPYFSVRKWLLLWIQSPDFEKVMKKFIPWNANTQTNPVIFPLL